MNYYSHKKYNVPAFENKIKKTIFFAGCIFILVALVTISCRQSPRTIESTYSFIKPGYTGIQLVPQPDSLNFHLSQNTYNEIKSFNYFLNKGVPLISFYDRRSESVSIYDFSSQERIKKIRLKKYFRSQTLYKTSVYVKNFDSIFVANAWTLYLIDSAGRIKDTMDFFKNTYSMACFENEVTVTIKDNIGYMGVRPYVEETSFSALRKWRILYGFDLKKGDKELYYSLPAVYQTNLYNDRFFAYSYCNNDKGNFVFSFPADTNIYETNLADYHIAYYGKSRFQYGTIPSFGNEHLKNDEGRKQYLMRDCYGPVYYDAFRKKYLRLAWQKISEADYEKGTRRKQSIIIFDQHFRIIGESEMSTDLYLNSLFITADGKIYARAMISDEYNLHFIRLAYADNNKDSIELVDQLPDKNK